MKDYCGRSDYKGSKKSRVEFLPAKGNKGITLGGPSPSKGSTGSKKSSIDTPTTKGNKGVTLGKPVVRTLKSKTSDERLGD